MEKHGRTQILCTIAAVLGIHFTVICMLLTASRGSARRTESQSLEIAFIARPPISLGKHLTRRLFEKAAPRRRAADNPVLTSHAESQADESNAIHPPTDWANELSRYARDAATEEAAPKPRGFGFPHTPSTHTDKRPQFGWDYAATHRVEAIPEGGLIIHLNDNCVLILFPLPFGECAIGKRKANGDLFKHMNDPSRLDP
jgi:hypothetical protein